MSAIYYPALAQHAGTMIMPDTRGPMLPNFGVVLARQRLPSDAIGTTACTFQGINANSEIRVYLPDGTEAAGVELCDANHVLTWNVYPAGNANNTVTIRIVHPSYKIKEFTYIASLGAQSIPVQQEPDRWYSNPA